MGRGLNKTARVVSGFLSLRFPGLALLLFRVCYGLCFLILNANRADLGDIAAWLKQTG